MGPVHLGNEPLLPDILMMLTPLAYLDPGSGSLFLQLLLGGLAGAAVLCKLLWSRILSVFGIRFETTSDTTSDTTGQLEKPNENKKGPPSRPPV